MIDIDRAFAGMTVESAHRVIWQIPADLAYFEGHFPGNPVFPAVGIIDATVFALGLVRGRAVELDGIPVAKFTQTLGPDARVALEFTADAVDRWSVEWRVGDPGRPIAQLSLRLRTDV